MCSFQGDSGSRLASWLTFVSHCTERAPKEAFVQKSPEKHTLARAFSFKRTRSIESPTEMLTILAISATIARIRNSLNVLRAQDFKKEVRR